MFMVEVTAEELPEYEMASDGSNFPSGFYEGCGKEGPLRCIFLCQFHPVAGPKITCQVPENYMSKDRFDAISVYTIPKPQLQRSTITVTLLGIKILGFPVGIIDKKYARNELYFNLCFVCDSWARTVHYEPVVKKLTDYLVGMEMETSFLSGQQDADASHTLHSMLTKVLADLNSTRMCNLTEGSATTHLKLVLLASDPSPVMDHNVPIFVDGKKCLIDQQMDLTTQQVLPYIDGFNHVSKIAAEADCENNLVKSCIQNLIYYRVVTLIPIFQYSNVYAVTPKVRTLLEDGALGEQCLEFVSKCSRQQPLLKDVLTFYTSMCRGTSVRDLCLRLNPHGKRINERRLVQFGLLKGFIQRIHKYIIYNGPKDQMPPSPAYKYMNGLYSDDEICCATGMSSVQLDELLENDSKLQLICK